MNVQHRVAAHKKAREWQTEKQREFGIRLKVAEAALEANEGAKDVKKGDDAPEAIKAFKRLWLWEHEREEWVRQVETEVMRQREMVEATQKFLTASEHIPCAIFELVSVEYCGNDRVK
jgi:hypothetical protein